MKMELDRVKSITYLENGKYRRNKIIQMVKKEKEHLFYDEKGNLIKN